MSEQENTNLEELGRQLSGKLQNYLGKRSQDNPSSKTAPQSEPDESGPSFNYDSVKSIIEAKNEWESSVDSLEKLVLIVLDKDLNIVRANKTIELWEWGDVNEVKGSHIAKFIDPLISEESRYYFYRTWVELDGKSSFEWESKYNVTGNTLRFTFYPAKNLDKKEKDNNHSFYVLVIDDLSQRKKAEKSLKQYVSALEFERLVNSQKLEYVNNQLENKLKKEKISKKKLQESEQQLQILSKQLLEAQEDERKRVASELHDGVGQILGAVKYQIEGVMISQEYAKDNDEALQTLKDGFSEIINNIQSAMQEVKRVSLNLRPTMLDEIGVIKTLDWFFEDYKKIYKYEVTFDCNIIEDDIEDKMKVNIFRIVQESMNNIAKHANASRVTVSLKNMKNGIILRVMDDGEGFVEQEKQQEKLLGLGLKSMKERAEQSGAKFSIKSESGEGTIVQAIWVKHV
ncbi:MAG: sensor histidine kinase [Gammaproteobacteria bacterium]